MDRDIWTSDNPSAKRLSTEYSGIDDNDDHRPTGCNEEEGTQDSQRRSRANARGPGGCRVLPRGRLADGEVQSVHQVDLRESESGK